MTKALLDEPTLDDRSIQAAEEAYDNFVREAGTRSPYLNTRAFRLAFDAALRSSAPQEPVATGCPQTVFPDQQNFTQELRATAAGFAKFPQERSTATKLIKAADLIDALIAEMVGMGARGCIANRLQAKAPETGDE